MARVKGKTIARWRAAEIFGWKDDQVPKLYLAGSPATDAEQELQTTMVVHKAGLPGDVIWLLCAMRN